MQLIDSQVLSKDDHCWKGCEEEGFYVSASLQVSYTEYANLFNKYYTYATYLQYTGRKDSPQIPLYLTAHLVLHSLF